MLSQQYDLELDHMHVLDHGFSRPNLENSRVSGMGDLIDIEHKRCESDIHDYDLSVTMVRCKDLPDSDRDDLRRRHAVDSSNQIHVKQ